MNDMNKRRIGLALSGGGVRAIAFHAGILRWFAERGLFENIKHISTVSGGSLFTGLVFALSNYCWPASSTYIDEVSPRIRDVLTNKSIQFDALKRLLLNPLNWRYFLSRANIISQAIEDYWGIDRQLRDLPESPVWSINGTTAETGRRFRFKGIKIGDYESGYADAPNYKIADAMAVSAAFPGGIGPLALNTQSFNWSRRKNWDALDSNIIDSAFTKLHLYDGGVYDNLGLEPLFDIGKQAIKDLQESPKLDFIVTSDAGAPFKRLPIPGPLCPSRLQRVADVAFDQARALRVRSFVNFLVNNSDKGMYLQIGSDPTLSLGKFGKMPEKTVAWLSTKSILDAVSYKTTLSKMKVSAYNLLEEHGYQTARWNEIAFY